MELSDRDSCYGSIYHVVVRFYKVVKGIRVKYRFISRSSLSIYLLRIYPVFFRKLHHCLYVFVLGFVDNNPAFNYKTAALSDNIDQVLDIGFSERDVTSMAP